MKIISFQLIIIFISTLCPGTQLTDTVARSLRTSKGFSHFPHKSSDTVHCSATRSQGVFILRGMRRLDTARYIYTPSGLPHPTEVAARECRQTAEEKYLESAFRLLQSRTWAQTHHSHSRYRGQASIHWAGGQWVKADRCCVFN